MRITHPALLKNALHNLDKQSGASNDYCTGLTVGVVSALMAVGFSFKDAIAQVAIHMPAETSKPRYAFPESWLNDVFAARMAIEPLDRSMLSDIPDADLVAELRRRDWVEDEWTTLLRIERDAAVTDNSAPKDEA